MSKFNNPNSQQGFSLIEVILAISILAIICTMTAQAIQAALRNKKIIQEQIDDVSRLRDAVKIIEKDIQLAFHHQDLEKELEDLAKKQKSPTPKPKPGEHKPPTETTPTPTAEPAEEKRQVSRQDPVTHFMGYENRLNFVSQNSPRLVQGQRQADFLEVGYELKDCKSPDGKSSSKCLFRRTDAIVDDDVEKASETSNSEFVLLENVTEFALKYFGKGKQDWVSEWKTNAAGDGATKGNFPLAVELWIKIEKAKNNKLGKKKVYSLNVVVPLHFPNNIEKTANKTSQGDPNAASPPQDL